MGHAQNSIKGIMNEENNTIDYPEEFQGYLLKGLYIILFLLIFKAD